MNSVSDLGFDSWRCAAADVNSSKNCYQEPGVSRQLIVPYSFIVGER